MKLWRQIWHIFFYLNKYFGAHTVGLWGFLGGSAGKESACNAGQPGLIPRSGRSPGDGMGYPLQYSWASLVAQKVKNLPAIWETWVRNLSWEDPLEEGMATHSSILAWSIPWTEEPGGLESIGLQRVRHDWVASSAQHHGTIAPTTISVMREKDI